jgi:low temperature requirement protein LtrA
VGVQQAEREQRVTPLELLFDLVFVFAFIEVTISCSTIGHGMGSGTRS